MRMRCKMKVRLSVTPPSPVAKILATPMFMKLTGTLKLRGMESAGKAEYGKPLMATSWNFTHVIRYAFHLSRFQSVPRRRATSRLYDYDFVCTILTCYSNIFILRNDSVTLYFYVYVCKKTEASGY